MLGVHIALSEGLLIHVYLYYQMFLNIYAFTLGVEVVFHFVKLGVYIVHIFNSIKFGDGMICVQIEGPMENWDFYRWNRLVKRHMVSQGLMMW